MLPTAQPSVIFQKVADGAVLFAPETEIYFGLNEVGTRVWELLPPACRTLEEVVGRLQAAYPDTPGETIRQDVIELLADLVGQGLAKPPGTSPGANDPAR
jgi:hypothetical protein